LAQRRLLYFHVQRRMPDAEPPGGGLEPQLPGGMHGVWRVAGWILLPVSLGALWGVALPGEPTATMTARVSAALGWSYFLAWSVSFYPQVAQNFRRRSVRGLSFDYQLLNVTGFACYFVFNAAYYGSRHVRAEYRDEHEGNDAAVELNDVVFAGHAAIITVVTLVQIAAFWDYPPLDRSERWLRCAVTCAVALVLIMAFGMAITIWATSERYVTWLAYCLTLSQVKVAISVCKYTPQVWLNYKRQSTEGWNIVNVLLDFTGGLLSDAQLIFDAASANDWSAVVGNPGKLALGLLSMLFDVVFMVQHYCLYPGRSSPSHLGRQVDELHAPLAARAKGSARAD